MLKNFIKYFLIIFIIYSFNILAQNKADTSRNFLSKNISVTGDIGAYGELYSISGRMKRRPSATGRIYFRPTLHLFNLIDIPFEFLISTEGSSARQNINQFGINPSWKWITFHIGDFTESFSNYSLNGLMIRGGGITVKPGAFNLSLLGGYTQRAVSGGASNGSYDRYLYGAKIGVGKSNGSYFNLIFLRVRDIPSSLPPASPSITVLQPNGGDVFPVGSIQTIRWTSVNLPDNVKIELSTDGGSTFKLLFANEPNVGSVSWTVLGNETDQGIIKISSMNDSTISDMSDEPFTIGSNVNGQAGNIRPVFTNGAAVTPQENLVGGATWNIELLSNKIFWQSEVDGSIYTRDMRASSINMDSSNIPNFVKSIYSPKISTNVDYSVHTAIGLRLQNFNAKLGYKLIGPGYTSLGLPYLINDQQVFNASSSFRISKFGINLNWLRSNDNLINQKLFTTVRNQYNISLSGMLTSYWNGNIMTGIMNMGNNSNNDTTKIDFSSFILSTNHNFIFKKESIIKTINVAYSYQFSGDNSPLRKNSNSIINNINCGVSFQLSKKITANGSAGFISSSFGDTIKTNTTVFSLGARDNFMDNKLSTSFSISTSANGNNNAINTRITSGYKISKADRIYFSLIANYFHGGSFVRSSFNEYIASISLSHRF